MFSFFKKRKISKASESNKTSELSMSRATAMVPYNGKIEIIDEFYKTLGFEINKGILPLQNFELIFGGSEDYIYEFILCITVNKDFSEIEAQVVEKGGKDIEYGFGTAGPCLVVTDPAGLKIHIGYEKDYLVKKLQSVESL